MKFQGRKKNTHTQEMEKKKWRMKKVDHFICLHVENNLLFSFLRSFTPIQNIRITLFVRSILYFHHILAKHQKRKDRATGRNVNVQWKWMARMKKKKGNICKNRLAFHWLINENGIDNKWTQEKKGHKWNDWLWFSSHARSLTHFFLSVWHAVLACSFVTWTAINPFPLFLCDMQMILMNSNAFCIFDWIKFSLWIN